jgi:hypothetical protein
MHLRYQTAKFHQVGNTIFVGGCTPELEIRKNNRTAIIEFNPVVKVSLTPADE